MRFENLVAYAAFCGLVSGVATANILGISSGCTAFTQYVTNTVTASSSESDGSNIAAIAVPTTTSSITTVTSISTLTNFITVLSQNLSAPPVSVTPVSTASNDAYYYIDVNGTTSWINGDSPPSTYSTFVTQTTQLIVYPTEAVSAQDVLTTSSTDSTTGTLSPIIIESTGEISTLGLATTSTVTSPVTQESTPVSIVFVTSSGQPSSLVPGLSGWNVSLASASESTITGAPVTIDQTVEYASSTAPSGTLELVTRATFSADSNATIPNIYAGSNTGVSIADVRHASLSVPNTTTPTIATPQSLNASLLTSQAVSTTLLTTFTNTTTSISTGSTPTPSVCGEHGNFTLTWDDEPTFSPTEPITDPSEAPPVFNPYHHLYFSNGYVYMPPPSDPFAPISAPRLVMFLTNDTGPSSSTNAGDQRPGEIGAGDRASESAFWFDAYSAYLGCDYGGPDNCTMQISGYAWQDSVQSEVLTYQQNVSLPTCHGLQNCKLQQVMFPRSMKGLSGIQIQAFAHGKQRMWFMDNLSLAWSNNTCAAGLLRTRSQ